MLFACVCVDTTLVKEHEQIYIILFNNSGAMLDTDPEVRVSILRACGTKIEDIDFPGLGDIIPMLAKRSVSFRNSEDASKIPEILKSILCTLKLGTHQVQKLRL